MKTNDKSLVSIIVPVYNTENYLEECLSSLLNQTYKDIEILCIDDGSTDASPLILDTTAQEDSRVRVFHRSNAGVSSARNFALGVAKGRYVLFVDSDDYISLRTCERLVEVAEKNKAEIVVFGGETFPPTAEFDFCLATPNFVLNDSMDALFEVRGSYPLMCNKMYSRELIERNKLRFNEKLIIGEDNAFQFCIFPDAKCVAFCQDSLYFYRCSREGSAIDIVYSDKVEKVNRHLDVVEYVVDEWKKRGFLSKKIVSLCRWITYFLYDDVKDFSFVDRAVFARKFNSFCHESGIEQGMSSLEGLARECYLFLSAEKHGPAKVSFIVIAKGTSIHLRQSFASLASQTQVDLEFLCVDLSNNKEIELQLDECIKGDPRAQLIGKDESCVRTAVDQAKGEYIVIADFNDEYDLGTASKLLEAAERGGRPDLITFRNKLFGLRTQSSERLLRSFEVPSKEKQPRNPVHPCFCPKDYTQRLYNFSSLSCSNKAFRRDFLQGLDFVDASEGSIARFIMAASSIMPIEEFLIEKMPLSGVSGEPVRLEAEGLLKSLASLKRILIEEEKFSCYEKTYVNAVLSAFSSYCDLLQSREALEAFYPCFRQAIDELIPFETYGPEWFFETKDYVRAQKLDSLTPEDFVDDHNSELIKEMSGLILLLEQIKKDQTEVIEEYDDSISYRAGRFVTWLPRKVVGLVRKTR